MIKKVQYLSLTICLVFLFGCDSEQSHEHWTDSHNHQLSSHHPSNQSGYQKPGANIKLSHNYDGHTAAGETETVELKFTEQYSSGQMYLRLKPDTSLSIEPAVEEYVFSMEDVTSHSIKLTFSAKSAGKHLLNIFASVMDESGKPRNRIMAVAFYVGDSSHKSRKPQAPSPTDKVIILPSIESGS